jgi:hypothetical protein
MLTWNYVTIEVLRRPCHTDLKVKKTEIAHPSRCGFYLGTGEPQGQGADYRKCLQDGKGLHIREYEEYYLIHWDKVDPSNFIGHLIEDAPHWIPLIVSAFAIFGIFMYALTES